MLEPMFYEGLVQINSVGMEWSGSNSFVGLWASRGTLHGYCVQQMSLTVPAEVAAKGLETGIDFNLISPFPPGRY